MVTYNPDDTITCRYRSICDVTFRQVIADETTATSAVKTALHIASWIVIGIKILFCMMVVAVLIYNEAAGYINIDIIQGIVPKKSQNNLHDIILFIYYANYARWILFTIGPRLLRMRLQRYRDLLIKIPNLCDTDKNVVLFIISDLLNFNMLNAILIIVGSKDKGSNLVTLSLPISFIGLQYLFPPHMIKAIFEPHVKELIVKPSILAYDCSLIPHSFCDGIKVFVVDGLLNWINFGLWVWYWVFLILGFCFVYLPVTICGYVQSWSVNWSPCIHSTLQICIIAPLLMISVTVCLIAEAISGSAFSLILTLCVLLIENGLIESSLVIPYFPDITSRLQPADNNDAASIDYRSKSASVDLRSSLLP